MPQPSHLEVYKGSSHTFRITVKLDGTATDITGYTIYFRVKDAIGDAANVIAKSSDSTAEIEILNQSTNTGKADIKLLPSDTYSQNEGRYYYDVWVLDTNSKRHDVLGPFNFEIKTPVTVLSPP